MASNRRRGRKRKKPDTAESYRDQELTSQPQKKKRKTAHSSREGVIKPKLNTRGTTDEKSLSEEPKLSLRRTHTEPNTTAPTHRPSRYYRDTEPDHPSETDSESQTDSENEFDRVDEHTSNVHSQPATPKQRMQRNRATPMSKSARRTIEQRTRTRTRSTSRLSPCKPFRAESQSISEGEGEADSDTEITPPLRPKHTRKVTPNWRAPMDSVSPLPKPPTQPRTPKRYGTEHTHKARSSVRIPIHETPVRRQMPFASHPRTLSLSLRKPLLRPMLTQPSSYLSKLWHRHGGKSLLTLLGFVAGFVVASFALRTTPRSVHSVPISATHTPNHINKLNSVIVDACSCDVGTNESSAQCSPCLDEYWTLHSECKQCHADYDAVRTERDALKGRLAALKEANAVTECESARTLLGEEVSECRGEVRRMNGLLGEETGSSECGAVHRRVDELEHRVGECSVEWGACEQESRQKDKLDERRLEEIGKHRERFALCNEQLKRYKLEEKAARKISGK